MNTAIALAALTALATTAGGILAIRVRDRLHLILGLSAGLLLGLVAFDLLPEIFELNTQTFGNVPVVSIAFVAGFLALHFAEQIFGSHEPAESDYGHEHDHSVNIAGTLGALAMGGHVFLDGRDIRKLKLRDLRQQIGVVFEETVLFNDTVSSNISFAKPNAAHADLERAAKLAGAHDFILQLPSGYETIIGERGFSRSGGQRQRIAIARAIISDPRVLVLDDATSAVDPSKEGEIRDAMRTVMSGRTTIVIAHRPGTIALAERVVFIDNSTITAIGKHEELVANNARYREVLASMELAKTAQSQKVLK